MTNLKFIVLGTLNRQVKIYVYHIYLWHKTCWNFAEMKWPHGHMLYVMYTELIYWNLLAKFSYIWISITGFSLLGEWGVPVTSQKFGHIIPPTPNFYSLPTKSQSPSRPPPLNKIYNPIKNVIFSYSHCLYHFCFNFMLFWLTGHANFDFNWCPVFTKCCL